eukprot:CAMPEP_0202966100 /NCGR_PEP_ID=MMETSP1396-20130829/10358_1 /ASSEMBLY_ACC=CAM_ASM_000872 /TAXON_ID= /ORGANISM="Pseudokeronopsis sp., Strain Brazil" /LENGTH=39 /DNA_ID= /DNA_START= /DNA_END= /DNA_ORIENTATION=
MPSGDAAQIAMLFCFLKYNNGQFYEVIGGDFFAFRIILL